VGNTRKQKLWREYAKGEKEMAVTTENDTRTPKKNGFLSKGRRENRSPNKLNHCQKVDGPLGIHGGA